MVRLLLLLKDPDVRVHLRRFERFSLLLLRYVSVMRQLEKIKWDQAQLVLASAKKGDPIEVRRLLVQRHKRLQDDADALWRIAFSLKVRLKTLDRRITARPRSDAA